MKCTLKLFTGVPRFSGACPLLLLLLLSPSSLPAAPMDDEKLFTVPIGEVQIHPRMAELMTAALNQPQQQTVLEALADIRNLKLTALADRVIKLLDDPRPLVRLSAAKVVEELDLKQAAPTLLKWTQKPTDSNPRDTVQIDQALIADKLLARWSNESEASKAWEARIAEKNAPTVLRISAITAYATQNRADLGRIAVWLNESDAPLAVRLAAADALAVRHATTAFTPSWAAENPLLTARMLTGISIGEKSEMDPDFVTLKKLAVNPEPAVQASALRTLLELNPKHVWPLAPAAAKSADPLVRLLAVQSSPTWTTSDAVEMLAPLLDDHHPDVRTEARKSLRTLAADKNLNASIRSIAHARLAEAVAEIGKNPAPHWRASEQAALLLGELDEKSAAMELVKTLDHARLEVRVASVIALRGLNVAETREPLINIFGKLADLTEARRKKMPARVTIEQQRQVIDANAVDSRVLDEVGQTLGVWRVVEADPALRRVIPKASAPTARARGGAIWALGLIHEGKPDARLAALLMERAADLDPVTPEAEEVRLASVITTGRMKATGQLAALQPRYTRDDIIIMCAARWAIMNITGKDLPPLTLPVSVRSDAFISPER